MPQLPPAVDPSALNALMTRGAGDSTAKRSGNRSVLFSQRGMPGGRALTGAFLITVAAVGTFAMSTGAGADNRQTYVVAARDLAPGTRLAPADLATVKLDLSTAVGSHASTSRAALAGSQLLGPLKSGELIQKSLVRPASNAEDKPEVSFALPAAHAVGGDIRSGEIIDILATDKSSASMTARTVLAGAVILRAERAASGGIGRTGDITVTVAVADRSAAAALVSAVDQGQVTIVRAGKTTSAP